MWSPISLAIASLFLLSLTQGNIVEISDDPSKQQKCNGMYSSGSWGGSIDPCILTSFDNSSIDGNSDAVVSVVIFEWRDEYLLGALGPRSEEGSQREIICFDHNVKIGLCNETQIGEFILQPNATLLSQSNIVTRAVHLKEDASINFPIRKTGYYCVWTYKFSNQPYRATVEFRNAYGHLPATQYPKLPFYGGLTIVYAAIGAFWAFLYVQNRHDILPVQNYITAILAFLVVEQLITWGYYDYQNRNGNDLGNKVLLFVTAILNAARNSFSFFLLLIVTMGYGVVRPSLGKTMTYVRILAIIHFVFGVIYGIASLSITPESAGPLVLLVIVPLAATLTAFYVWTLNSLSATLRDLLKRKQSVKALMYKRLWWTILGSIIIIFLFVAASSALVW